MLKIQLYIKQQIKDEDDSWNTCQIFIYSKKTINAERYFVGKFLALLMEIKRWC